MFLYPWLCWLHCLYSPVLSKKTPSVRWRAVPSLWYCADQCSDKLRGLGLLVGGSELSPPLVLSDRVSNPFRSSPGRESEVWQSSALSLWSSPLSFKLLQMCGESGHGAGPGRDGWLTGCRALNLPFNNSLMNPLRLLPVSPQSELRTNQHAHAQ